MACIQLGLQMSRAEENFARAKIFVFLASLGELVMIIAASIMRMAQREFVSGSMMAGRFPLILACLVAFALVPRAASAQALKKYRPVWSLAGKVRIAGSGALNGELDVLADAFQQIYPGVEIDVERNDGERTPAAFLAGAADLGSLSRTLTREESASIESRFGASPIRVLVGLDALAIYVNRDNPLACLSMPQLDRIFSANRIAGGGDAIERWGQVLSEAGWTDKAIVRIGRRGDSGSNIFFRRSVMDGDAFRRDVRELESGQAVVENVARDKYAIGYAGSGFSTAGVRAAALSGESGAPCTPLTEETVARGNYPLSRSLYIYAVKTKDSQTNLIGAEFLRFLVSREGQMKITAIGFIPIDRDSQEADLRRLKGLSARR